MKTTCLLDKKRLVEAFEVFTFDDIRKYYPSISSKEYVKSYLTMNKDEVKKEKMFEITAFMAALNMYFQCLMRPWALVDNARKKCAHYEIIDETYEKVKLKDKEKDGWNPDLYLIAKDFIRSIDDIYLKVCSTTYPIVLIQPEYFTSYFILRFNKLSVRGRHRAKLWDTFIFPRNVYSRRATPGKFYNLNPEILAEFDEIEDVDKKVKFITNIPHGDREQYGSMQWLDAVHPHISNSDACYGGWQNKLQLSADNGFADIYIKQIRGFLQTWTASSPFWNINHEFKKTYTFAPIKRRKCVNWGVVDSQWYRREIGELSAISNPFQPKLLAEEKHLNGYYTRDFAHKIAGIHNLTYVNHDNVYQMMHELEHKEKVKSGSFEVGVVYVSGWSMLKRLYLLGWKDLIFKVNLAHTTPKKRKSYSWIFETLMLRLKNLLCDYLYKELRGLTYLEIKSYQGAIKHTDILTLEKVINLYKEKYLNRTHSSLEELVDENLLMLDILENEKTRLYHINNWTKLTYESEITKINTQKESYIDAIKHISNNSEQTQLFSKEISF